MKSRFSGTLIARDKHNIFLSFISVVKKNNKRASGVVQNRNNSCVVKPTPCFEDKTLRNVADEFYDYTAGYNSGFISEDDYFSYMESQTGMSRKEIEYMSKPPSYIG